MWLSYDFVDDYGLTPCSSTEPAINFMLFFLYLNQVLSALYEIFFVTPLRVCVHPKKLNQPEHRRKTRFSSFSSDLKRLKQLLNL